MFSPLYIILDVVHSSNTTGLSLAARSQFPVILVLYSKLRPFLLLLLCQAPLLQVLCRKYRICTELLPTDSQGRMGMSSSDGEHLWRNMPFFHLSFTFILCSAFSPSPTSVSGFDNSEVFLSCSGSHVLLSFHHLSHQNKEPASVSSEREKKKIKKHFMTQLLEGEFQHPQIFTGFTSQTALRRESSMISLFCLTRVKHWAATSKTRGWQNFLNHSIQSQRSLGKKITEIPLILNFKRKK